MPTTTRSAIAVNISCIFVFAMVWKMGRSRYFPDRTTRVTEESTKRACIHFGKESISVTWAATVLFCRALLAKRGNRASMGMMAMSWKSNTAKELRPATVFIQPFSSRVCITMAVDDMEIIIPSTRAVFQSNPKARAIAVSVIVVPATCMPPIPAIFFRILQRRSGSSSRPMTKSIMTTPNSAKCMMSWPSVPMRPKKAGPMITPASRYPKTEPRPSLLAMGTMMTAPAR
ncbi:hypothetical protein D3C86_1081160 [compost metagenome]